MSQVTVGTTPDPGSYATAIPRPREAEPSATALAAPEAPTAFTSVARSSRRTSTLTLAIDSSLALALAAGSVALDRLPVPVALVAATVWPVALLLSGLYRRRGVGESRVTRIGLVLGTGLRAAVLTLAIHPWLPAVRPLALPELVALFSIASAAHQLMGVRLHRARVVLAGRPRDVREAMLALQGADGHEIVAVCLTRTSRVPFAALPTYVGFVNSSDVAHHHRADAFVVLPGARLTSAEVRRLHWALAGVGTELCVGTGLLDVTPGRTRILAPGGLNLVHVAPASLRGPRRLVKEVLERAAATVALVLVLPFLVVLAAAVRLDTCGPALYRQQRVGKGGRVFTMYKLRSMAPDAEAARDGLMAVNQTDGLLFKIQQDPRVTRFGGWLRRWSIDEVPQLWNVVRGDMSLVGPRPALPDEVARYDDDPVRRMVVKPGLTGLWQVSGRSDLSWAEAVRLDVRYVDNWSLGLDLAILARTVKAVLGRRGAY